MISDIGRACRKTDGYELIRVLRARLGRSFHAVAMTGFAGAESQTRCLELS